MINIDITLLYQIIGFFILLILLNTFLYKPVQRILKDREDRIEGNIKKAAETEETVAQGLVDYQKKLKEAAVKGHEERNRLRHEGIEKEKALIEAARLEAAKELSSIRKEIETSKSAALSGLKTEAKSLAREIAGKVLERTVAGLLVIAILLPSLALASTGAEHGEGSGMAWKLVNFGLLAVGAYLVWTKVLAGLLDKRSAEIKNAIEEAQRAKNEAERKASEYREQLSLLDKRVAGIATELKLEGEAEKARIISEAGKAAERLKEQAKVAAEQEIKKARLEIREEAAKAAVELAEQILKKEISPEDHERLVKGYLNNLRLN